MIKLAIDTIVVGFVLALVTLLAVLALPAETMAEYLSRDGLTSAAFWTIAICIPLLVAIRAVRFVLQRNSAPQQQAFYQHP